MNITRDPDFTGVPQSDDASTNRRWWPTEEQWSLASRIILRELVRRLGPGPTQTGPDIAYGRQFQNDAKALLAALRGSSCSPYMAWDIGKRPPWLQFACIAHDFWNLSADQRQYLLGPLFSGGHAGTCLRETVGFWDQFLMNALLSCSQDVTSDQTYGSGLSIYGNPINFWWRYPQQVDVGPYAITPEQLASVWKQQNDEWNAYADDVWREGRLSGTQQREGAATGPTTTPGQHTCEPYPQCLTPEKKADNEWAPTTKILLGVTGAVLLAGVLVLAVGRD